MYSKVRKTFLIALIPAVVLCLMALAFTVAQQPAGAAQGQKQTLPDDNTGFVPLFDGKTLTNWDGEPGFWRVENGIITGETTADKKLKKNTFLIWRGGTVANFELKAEFKVTESANSGVQYRSSLLSDIGPWVMKGYQADIDGKNNYTGMLYEERGRGFLAPRGQFNRKAEDGTSKQIGSTGDAEALKAFIKAGDWNQIHIIARGLVLTHVLNGHVMSMFIDEDPKGRLMEGSLGLQLHAGPPMKVEYRNILYRKL